MSNVTYTNEEGAKAIIQLQALANVTESMENAIEGWGRMSKSDKAATERVHKIMFPIEEN